jgi:hypothetical protein
MKSKTAILIPVLVVLSLAVVAFAAEMQKGTIKDVDIQAGTITFCQEGTTTDMTFKADKGIDLTTVKPETKAEVTLDMGTVKAIREMKRPRKAPVGC